ncbi:hypothetical protein [Aeromonas hydrophila]|uniref:hypothetical protein n=1 Tax=Aeromonas hydrophila TaxID=644 RepID=UPI002F403907
MEFILQLVSVDALSLLKQKDGDNKDDLPEVHHKLLIQLRSASRRAYRQIAEDGFKSVISQGNNLLDSLKLSQTERPNDFLFEALQSLIYDTSCTARKMIKCLRELFYYQVDGSYSVSDSEIKKRNAIKDGDLIISYLNWYSTFLGHLIKDGLTDKEISNYRDDYGYFNEKIERYLHSRNVDNILSSIEQSVDSLTSKAKSDSQAFIDQTLAAVSSKITENSIEADKSVAAFKRLISEFEEVRKKQSEYFSDIETVHDYCNTRKSSIDAIFIAANRQGMANSFSQMAKGLITPMVIWGGMLTLSLIFIVIAGYVIEADVLHGNLGNNTIVAISLRALVISPLIWLAWFSSRQFGHASKLRQDYSYKSAVAMAYQGYKDEATELSDGMHEKLLENIILHFSDNPVRLYEKNDASSPFDEILKKISPEKLSEIIKSLKS